MEWVETTGQTVAEALEKALERLGVAEADAEVIVLEEPKSSMFGLRKTPARVRARVRPVQARAKRPARRPQGEGRSRNRSSRPRNAEGGAPRDTTTGDGATRQKQGTSRSSSAGAGGASPRKRQRKPKSDEQRVPQEGAPSAETASRERSGQDEAQAATTTRTRSRSRSRRSQSAGDATNGSIAGAQAAVSDTEEEEMSIEAQAELAEEFVKGVIARFGLAAETTREITDDTVRIDVTGENLGLLIGPRGTTADALQELTRTAVQRRSDEYGVRIVVDVGGYRLRRAAALRQFAERVAAEVMSSGEPQALDPMNPADRKVVHDAVNEIAGVRTTSEGEEPRRFVVIHPTSAAPTAEAEAVTEEGAEESSEELA